MSATGDDAHELIRRIRMDMTNAQAKLTDLSNMLGSFDLPAAQPDVHCPHCGRLPNMSAQRLHEHMENVHGVTVLPDNA